MDTNIFLEYLLDQKRALEVEKLFRFTAKKGIPLLCSHFSLHGIEAILSNQKKFLELETFLLFVHKTSNLAVYETAIEEEINVAKLVSEKGLDFDDALQYFVTKKTDCQAIISFDKHFDKTDLVRATPEEILKSADNL
ncbi:PIN domain-containing protein [Candidatus Micrarchaeota archaeon]|nr:PIN domain-containing protein [Candidatus Micrarchaeota archaeon]